MSGLLVLLILFPSSVRVLRASLMSVSSVCSGVLCSEGDCWETVAWRAYGGALVVEVRLVGVWVGSLVVSVEYLGYSVKSSLSLEHSNEGFLVPGWEVPWKIHLFAPTSLIKFSSLKVRFVIAWALRYLRSLSFAVLPSFLCWGFLLGFDSGFGSVEV